MRNLKFPATIIDKESVTMKLLELKLQAFGTFPKEVTVDFNELGKEGIFLIVGSTGSGKTTIFDAICYALYGKPNGSDRNVKDFKSHFASKDTEMFVQLKFEHQGTTYIVHRGEDTANTNLKSADGTVLAKKSKDTDHFIRDLVGLSLEQFRQIVMIAQGEFKAFLLAKSDEKGKILNTVFGTQKFIDFKEKVHEKAETLKDEFERYDSIVVSKLRSIRCSDLNTTEFDVLKNPIVADNESRKTANAQNVKTVGEILSILCRYIEVLKDKKSTVAVQLDTITSQCNALSKKINDVNTLNENVRKYESIKSRLEVLQSQESIIEGYRKKADALRNAKSIEGDYSNYKYTEGEVLRLSREVNVLERSLERCSKRVESSKGELLSIKEKYPEMSGDTLSYLNSLKVTLSDKLSTVVERGKDLKDILDKLERYGLEFGKSTTLKKQYDSAYQYERHVSLDYDNQYGRFMSNLAGILAEQLLDGHKCPVCGSLHHPEKASSCKDVISKERLDDLKVLLEDAESRTKDLRNRLDVQMGVVYSLHSSIMERVEKYGISHSDGIDYVKSEVVRLREGLGREYKSINKSIMDVQRDVSTMSKVQNDLNQLNVEYASIDTSLANRRVQLQEVRTRYQNLKSNYFKLLEEYSIKDESTHLEMLKDYQQYETLDGRIREYCIEKSSNLKSLEDYSKLVGDGVTMDTTDLVVALNSLNTKRDILIGERSSIAESISTNTTIYEEVSNMLEDLENKRKKYLDAERLYNVANGTVSTTNGKMSFEGYIQAYYFEQVLECANRNIQTMSGGRYTLIRKEALTDKSKRTNLDIEVFDAYTCTKRNVSTLSGGESFMASLSLALGLSEMVQNGVGGIKIDAMFIDEGFSTLDSETSLQQAMKIIDNLATNDRVVGIISHVTDLQEHIDRKLYVKKSQYGSTIELI